MKISNKNAFHDYTILDRFEAGIKLTGPEVKSVKDNRVSLTGGFVRFIGNELFLVNAQIQPYEFARVEGYEPRRTRKLLISKNEMISLRNKVEGAGLTLVPLNLYTKHGLVKVEVGVGRGKKQFEKRELLKKRVQKREIERTYRGKVV